MIVLVISDRCFTCPLVFVLNSPYCVRYRIVLRQGCILNKTFEDIFKTLDILLVASPLEMPCATVGRSPDS